MTKSLYTERVKAWPNLAPTPEEEKARSKFEKVLDEHAYTIRQIRKLTEKKDKLEKIILSTLIDRKETEYLKIDWREVHSEFRPEGFEKKVRYNGKE